MVEEDEEAGEEGAGRFAESRVGGEDANEEKEDEQREELKERMRFEEDGRGVQEGRGGGGGAAAAKAQQREAPDEGQEGEQSEYEVENVVAYRETRRGVGEWRVRWKGFTAADDTWEKRANLEGSPAFWKKMDALQHKWQLERKRRSNARSNSKSRRRSTGRNAKGGGRGDTTAEDREAGEEEEEEEEEGNNVGEAWIHRKMPTSFRSAAEGEARGRSSGRGGASQTGVTGAATAATRGEKEEKEGKHRSAAPVPAAALEATGPPEVLVQERARGSRKSCGATREQSGSKNCNSSSSSRKSSSRNSVNRDSSRRTSSCSKNSRSRKSSSSRHRSRQGQAAGRVAAAAGGAGKFVAARAAAASGSAYRRKRGREPPRKKRRRRRKGSEAEGSESSVFDFSDSSVSSFPVSSFLEEEEETAGEETRERERAGRKNQGERAAADAEHDTEEEEGSAEEEEESDERSSRGGEEEGDDVSECSSGSTTAEDMNDPFDASVYPIIYSNDTEPPTSHLPDEKLLGERLSIYRFRYHQTDTRQYLRLRRRKCEAGETSSLSDEDEEEEEEEEEAKKQGEAEQCQEKECSSSSRTSRPERSSSNNRAGEEEAAEGGGRRGEKDRSARGGGRRVWSTAFPRKTKREFTTVLVQYMIDAKYVYALPFERMRFYCPQLLLSYLMARTTFKGTRTGKQRRLTELEEEGDEQEESEQEAEEEAAGNCGGSSPATEKTGADDSESEEQQHEGHDNMALHPPAEGRQAASEPADFTEGVKIGNRQESETEETEDDGKKPIHKQLVPVSGEEQMDHRCAGRDGDTEATNNVRCVEDQPQQQIHRKTQRETVHGSLDLSDKTADNVDCASSAHMQYNSHTCKRRRAGAAALAATASGAIARGATATVDETSAGGAAAGAPGGNAEVVSKQRDAAEVSDDDSTASIKEGQQAASATASTTHCVAEKGDRRCEIPPPEPDVHAVLVTEATGTEGAVDTANEQTPVELPAAQDVAEMAVPAAGGDVSAAGGDTVEAPEAAHAVWMNSRRGEQAVRRNAAEDAGRGRRTGGKRENSRRREAAAGGSCSHKRGAGVSLQGAHAASSDDNVVATTGESEDACSTAVDQQAEKGVRSDTRAEEHGSTSLQCYSTSSRTNKQQGRDVHSHDGVHTSVPLPTSRTRSQQSARLQGAQPR